MASHIWADESAIAEPQDPAQAVSKMLDTFKQGAESLFPKEKLEVICVLFDLYFF